MTTALTLYQTQSASTTITKADVLATATGGTTSSRNTAIGTSTGYGEATSQGTAVAWPALSAPTAPSGHGWLWDVTTLEGMQFPAGNWTPTLQLSVSVGSITADLHVRCYVYDSIALTYTQFGADIVLAAQSITTATTTYAFSAAALPYASFFTGQKYYYDVWPNITANSTGSGAAVLKVWASTSATQGNVNAQMVTPGYQVQPSYSGGLQSGWNDVTPPFGAFYGIWQFHGQDSMSPGWTNGSTTPPTPPYTNSSASLSYVAGAVLPYTWAQLNPSSGTYVWSLIDNDMAPWIAAGKQVHLRVFTGGTHGTDGSVAHYGQTATSATPSWVFSAGAASVTALDGVSILPVYWDTTYQAKYQTFITAFAARYDGNPNVQSVLIGTGCFGEPFVDETNFTNAQKLTLWQTAGYTQTVWTNAVTWTVGAYKTAFKSTPLVMAVNSMFLDADGTHNQDTCIALAQQNNVWLEDNGLVNKLTTPTNIQHHANSAWLLMPNIEEQLKSAIQTGSTLSTDMALNMSFGGLYAYIYTADIQNAANTSVLAHYASVITTPHSSGYVSSAQKSGQTWSYASGVVNSALQGGIS